MDASELDALLASVLLEAPAPPQLDVHEQLVDLHEHQQLVDLHEDVSRARSRSRDCTAAEQNSARHSCPLSHGCPLVGAARRRPQCTTLRRRRHAAAAADVHGAALVARASAPRGRADPPAVPRRAVRWRPHRGA
eukprot:1977717-Prymnesium_polylepis.1